MLHTLISSKTRIKLLLKFFLNSDTRSHLRALESEFGESSNAIRLELNRLEEAGMLTSASKGNKKIFQANLQHPLFGDIHGILMKYIGLDHVIENVVKRLGEVEQVFLVGEFSKGLDSQIIDLIFVGNMDQTYLVQLIEKVEKLISRKIRYLVFAKQEFSEQQLDNFSPSPLLLWEKEK
ncbi:MAG: hypothetical protein RL757_2469 [Bacteroidota bacterium]|jgi:hypothetical protein